MRRDARPAPWRIDIFAAANASAHVDNGFFGLFRRRLVLTHRASAGAVDDPASSSPACVAHELGHFSQGSSMRLSYVVHNINRWFARMAYGRSGIDDMLDAGVNSDSHWSHPAHRPDVPDGDRRWRGWC